MLNGIFIIDFGFICFSSKISLSSLLIKKIDFFSFSEKFNILSSLSRISMETIKALVLSGLNPRLNYL